MVDALFDASSLYARAWFAGDGKIGEVYEISTRLVLNVLSETKIDRMLFCWDGAQKRDKGRGPKPPNYAETIDDVIKLLTNLFGAAHIRPQTEADDAVATATYASLAAGHEVVVVSSDKDLTQLLGDGVRYYDLNEKAFISRHFVTSRWKIKRPVQVAIALAIIGDTGDNIQGIRGWGPKKVEKLFEKVKLTDDLTTVLDHIVSQIPEEQLHEFYSSLELTLLDTNVPGIPEPAPLTLDISNLDEYGLEKLYPLFSRARRTQGGATEDDINHYRDIDI